MVTLSIFFFFFKISNKLYNQIKIVNKLSKFHMFVLFLFKSFSPFQSLSKPACCQYSRQDWGLGGCYIPAFFLTIQIYNFCTNDGMCKTIFTKLDCTGKECIKYLIYYHYFVHISNISYTI